MAVSCLVALILLLGSLGGTASAANTASFTDVAGDGDGGPDIVRVSVSSDDSGTLTFVSQIAGIAQSPQWGVGILVDSDANYATGHSDGVDHLLSLEHGHVFGVTRWD